MGLIDDKKSIFNEIGALTSVKDNFNLPNPTNSLSSVNNSKEIIPFLLDLLTVLIGSQALQSAVGEIMTTFVRNVEPILKTELKNQVIDFNSESLLPNGFIGGYRIQAKDIDSFGKLKNDPSSQLGSLLYSDNNIDFDQKSYEAILSPGTDITFNNLKINYDESTDEFIYTPVSPSTSIGDFTNEFIDGLIIINEKEFITKIINQIFGSVSSQENKTQQEIIFEDKINRTLEKIIDEDENILISDSELREIESNAQKKVQGIQTVDVGCDVLITNVDIDSLENLIAITTGSTDPLNVGNSYSSLVNDSFSTNDVEQQEQNNEAIKDGFFKRLINAIVFTLVSAITSPPQIRALLGIISGFKNNDVPDIGNPINDLENKQKLINCLSNKSKETINEFIFDLIKRELISLIIPVSKIILKEKINQYLAILRSLIGFI